MHSLVINTNVPSIVAQNATKHTDRLMTNAMEKLSTGYRINDAGDDAAGLVPQSCPIKFSGQTWLAEMHPMQSLWFK